ncbi:MAG TPA: glycosyltransferase [Gemmatimonadaceae bacterium]|nr:glycosyltransferase [Gemmatimonadaceae bacterium]
MSHIRCDVRRLGYLSGAPRVSTRADAELAGPRAHVLGVIAGFEAAGWTVDRFIVGDRGPAVVARDGERLVRRGWATTLAADGARLVLRQRSAASAYAALGTHVDWVYERFALFQAMGTPFARRGIPWILETNALLADEARRERSSVVLHATARQLERAAYHACSVLVTVSDVLADRIADAMDVPREKIVVVPNGVDVERFDPARVAPRHEGTGFRIVFAGSLAPWQGLDALVRALVHVPAAVAVIAGDGPARRGLEALAAELEVEARVRFLGHIDDVPAFLAGGDVCFVGHTDRGNSAETFRSPLKLYEYLAMGKPVISSSVPDAVATITEGKTGFLFQPDDVASLVRAIGAAMAAPLEAMGARARREAVERHSWQARVHDMIAQIESRVGVPV